MISKSSYVESSKFSDVAQVLEGIAHRMTGQDVMVLLGNLAQLLVA
jgi:hypothetical protein